MGKFATNSSLHEGLLLAAISTGRRNTLVKSFKKHHFIREDRRLSANNSLHRSL
jgi:hypothetical protein